MKKLMITAFVMGFLTFLAQARHTEGHAHDVTVKVNGMVCDFCAQSITKLFMEHTEVDKVNINLDSKEVTLDFKPGASLPSEEISKVIDFAGYEVEDIVR